MSFVFVLILLLTAKSALFAFILHLLSALIFTALFPCSHTRKSSRHIASSLSHSAPRHFDLPPFQGTLSTTTTRYLSYCHIPLSSTHRHFSHLHTWIYDIYRLLDICSICFIVCFYFLLFCSANAYWPGRRMPSVTDTHTLTREPNRYPMEDVETRRGKSLAEPRRRAQDKPWLQRQTWPFLL